MSGQRLTCDVCGWTCNGEKGMTLEDAHRDCPGPKKTFKSCSDAYEAEFAPPGTFLVQDPAPHGGPLFLYERFPAGSYFCCGGKAWKVTDIGTRVVVAIEHRPGWTSGPPYEAQEVVFDEEDQKGCEGPIAQGAGMTMDETLAALLAGRAPAPDDEPGGPP